MINYINKIKKYIDDPYEKIKVNVISIFIFSLIYYLFYINDKENFIVNNDILKKKEDNKLNYRDFLYFSILTNFTITFGDIIPGTGRVKLLTGIQVFLFWYITLF
tara:strand:- start:1082 stop:1396 length:315 start_codon:yes stop_codon:yes gene_type:complete